MVSHAAVRAVETPAECPGDLDFLHPAKIPCLGRSASLGEPGIQILHHRQFAV